MIELLLTLVILIIVIGLVMYLIDLAPIDARFKQMAKVVLIFVLVLIVLMQVVPLVGVGVDLD